MVDSLLSFCFGNHVNKWFFRSYVFTSNRFKKRSELEADAAEKAAKIGNYFMNFGCKRRFVQDYVITKIR